LSKSKPMFKVYGIPNCNTVKKTIKWLEDNQVKFEFHNYRTDGLDTTKLENWIEQRPLDILVNKVSTSYRSLTDVDKERVFTRDGALALLPEKPTLIKRPVIEDSSGKIVAVGFNESEYNTLFKK